MEMNRNESLVMNNPLRRLVQKYVEFKVFKEFLVCFNINLNHKVLLDVGCGCGFSSELISFEYQNSSLHAFDISYGQIEMAKKREVYADFYVWDATDIPLTSSSV